MKKVILTILLVLLAGCVNVETPLVVNDGDVLPENICNNLDNNIIVIHKTGCPACAVAIPILGGLEKELNKEFIYYNVAVEEERNKLLSFGFISRYVPTIVVNCKAYSGALDKQKYKELLQ